MNLSLFVIKKVSAVHSHRYRDNGFVVHSLEAAMNLLPIGFLCILEAGKKLIVTSYLLGF